MEFGSDITRFPGIVVLLQQNMFFLTYIFFNHNKPLWYYFDLDLNLVDFIMQKDQFPR